MWFHSTLFPRVATIARSGLRPRRSHGALFEHSVYGYHGRGKLFLAKGLEAAREWFCRVQAMGEGISDEIQDHIAVMLRVCPCVTPVLDPIGDKDISGSYYTTHRIPPCRIEFWHPTRGWALLSMWSEDLLPLGIKEVEGTRSELAKFRAMNETMARGGSYTNLIEILDSENGPTLWSFACWENGGFKPPRSVDQ